jgi:hypothetical protein
VKVEGVFLILLIVAPCADSDLIILFAIHRPLLFVRWQLVLILTEAIGHDDLPSLEEETEEPVRLGLTCINPAAFITELQFVVLPVRYRLAA